MDTSLKMETPSVGAQGGSQTTLDSGRSEDGNTSAGVNGHSAPSPTGFNPCSFGKGA